MRKRCLFLSGLLPYDKKIYGISAIKTTYEINQET